MLSIGDALKTSATREGAILAVLHQIAAAEGKVLFGAGAKPTVDRAWLLTAIREISDAFGGPASAGNPSS